MLQARGAMGDSHGAAANDGNDFAEAFYLVDEGVGLRTRGGELQRVAGRPVVKRARAVLASVADESP